MLGRKAKDIVTGFTGIVTAKCEYLSGCTQYKIDAPVTDGHELKYFWVDVDRIEVLEGGLSYNKTINGGPAVNMPKPQHP